MLKTIITISFTVISIPLLAYAFWKLWFLRNPKRKIPTGKNLIISPADGKVLDIISFDEKKITFNKGNKRIFGQIKTITEDIAKEGYMISIFMSPLDVHYNRSPIKGTIKSVKHFDGKLLPVNSVSAGLQNEKTETIIESEKFKLKVIQIAGFLARRIETFVQPEDIVRQGKIFGLINLGSQVTIIMPKNVELKIKKGQRVKAGETIIGLIK